MHPIFFVWELRLKFFGHIFGHIFGRIFVFFWTLVFGPFPGHPNVYPKIGPAIFGYTPPEFLDTRLGVLFAFLVWIPCGFRERVVSSGSSSLIPVIPLES